MRINLLPKEERPLKQSQVRWEFMVSLLGLLALGAVLVLSYMAHSTVNTLTTVERDAQNRERALMQQVNVVNAIKKEIAALEQTEQAYLALMASDPACLTALPILTTHFFPGLWIEAMKCDKSRVELTGYTQNVTSLSQYLYYLNERSEEATLTSIRSKEGTDFRVFSVEIEGVAQDDPA